MLTWETRTGSRQTRYNFVCKGCHKRLSVLVTVKTETIYRSDRISPVSRSQRFTVDGREVAESNIVSWCCNRPMSGGPVKGTRNESVPCDHRCTEAKGHKCECSCGGLNHGASHE